MEVSEFREIRNRNDYLDHKRKWKMGYYPLGLISSLSVEYSDDSLLIAARSTALNIAIRRIKQTPSLNSDFIAMAKYFITHRQKETNFYSFLFLYFKQKVF